MLIRYLFALVKMIPIGSSSNRMKFIKELFKNLSIFKFLSLPKFNSHYFNIIGLLADIASTF